MIKLGRGFASRTLQGSEDSKLPRNLDCLVYSSHKTGTQTVLSTLNNSGVRAQHLHLLANVGMRPDTCEFRNYLEHYRQANRRKLTVISIFRLPWERHMSSFFQWHAQGVVRERLVSKPRDTIVAKYDVDELQRVFRQQIREGSLRGREDSLEELCDELGYTVASLPFDPERRFAVREDELIRLLLFRFDLLFPDFKGVLEEALQMQLSPRISNRSDDKWYAEKYRDFGATLTATPDLISGVHQAKKDLIDVFYPLQYEAIVESRIARYAPSVPG